MSDSRNLVLATLASDSFVCVNKKLIRYFKGDANLATVLCELLAIYKMQKSLNRVDDLDAFPLPIKIMEKNLGMTAYKQQSAINRLQADNIVTQALIGMPAVRHIAINFDVIEAILDADETTQEQKKAAEFYSNITDAAYQLAQDPCQEKEDELRASCQNMDSVLKDLVVLFTAFGSPGRRAGFIPKWTGRAVGNLKYLLREQFKNKRVDYNRIRDALLIYVDYNKFKDADTYYADVIKALSYKIHKVVETPPFQLNALFPILYNKKDVNYDRG